MQRLVTPVLKYWTCKRAPQHAAEALECLGGAGYVEESGLPRLFRQSPLNGVWEGSGNVIALDVLRALAKAPESLDAYWDEVLLAAGNDGRLDEASTDLRKDLDAAVADPEHLEASARRLVEHMALVWQGALLVQHAPAAVADAFCASRFTGSGRAFGTMPVGPDAQAIVDRARPEV
ncbi:hypothetical protein B7486_75480 [cyanobacterium TDX16]|nr:hypothetical protein B7486_75480 [cyanobacterium TDX16]